MSNEHVRTEATCPFRVEHVEHISPTFLNCGFQGDQGLDGCLLATSQVHLLLPDTLESSTTNPTPTTNCANFQQLQQRNMFSS